MKHLSARAAVYLVPIVAATSLLAPDRASAVVTSVWTVDSYQSWNEGEPEGAFVSSIGEVRPGWGTKRTELSFDNAWAAVRAADGTIYLGTDDHAAIYKIQGDKVDKLVAIEDDAVAVVSLVLAPDGTLYAGTMPGGKVWKVDVKTAKATELASLDEVETVWALVLSKDGKTLYAGTGPKGKLFEIDLASGKAKVTFDTEDKRVLSLARTDDGAIWFGTSDKALLFRYDPATKATRAMADFSGNEVTAIAGFEGGVIALANEFKEPSTSGYKTKAAVDKAEKKKKTNGEKPKTPKTDSKPGADKANSGGEVPRPGARKGKGSLYRVYGDSRLEQLHTLSQTYFSALAIAENGDIFAGAGDKGRIYLIDEHDAVSTVFDVAERMVSQLIYDPKDGLAFTTGDAAAFYRATERAKKSSYVSKAFDTNVVSRFGRLVWRGSGKFQVETRSGNTAEPGIGWSEWQAPNRIVTGGGGEVSGGVVSPSGRYLQFRISFAGDPDAVLRRVTAYYLPQNRATRITEITVGDDSRGKLVTTKSGEAKPRSPVVKVKWKVDNDDKDSTAYTLAVRREGNVLWRPLATGKKPLTSTSFDWNTETFPDGYYRLRVTASDRLANSAERTLVDDDVTELFLLDNTRPEISKVTVDYPNASARASDAMSAIAEMAFSIDDQPWRIGSCQDGIFDQQTEFLKVTLPTLEPGVHTLALRVADEAGNIGSSAVTFRVK